MDQSYSMYSTSDATIYHQPIPYTNHYDGAAFWYRPSHPNQVYGRSAVFVGELTPPQEAGLDSRGVKHRRTRSGCFTCRTRRVKCDETRPMCERCRKGGRECEFPQSSSSLKRSKHEASRRSQLDSSRSKVKEEEHPSLDAIEDESNDEETQTPDIITRPRLEGSRTQSSQSLSWRQKTNQRAESYPATGDQISPQSTSSSTSHSVAETNTMSAHTGTTSAEILARHAKIKTLKPAMQKYLQFQHDHMTYYHYFFKLDPTDFVHNEFIDQALSFEPLLYAVVAYAAYHYELQQSDGRVSHFLGYYSKSLSLLRKSLESHTQFTEAMLLTVLQLATFEECMGDWVNLVGHHRAAHTMVVNLYTPETMMKSDLGRRIFSWYGRLDVIVGLMAGNSTRLDRAFYDANLKWYYSQIDTDPEGDVDIENMLAYIVACNRVFGMDMALLFAKLPKGEISIEDFERDNAKLASQLVEMKHQLQSMNDDFYTVQEFPIQQSYPVTENDIVNPYIPGGLFKDALWALNYMWLDWYGIEQMHKYQYHLLLQKPLPTDHLEQNSLEQCRIVEAIERWPDAPEGSLLGCHASLTLAILFLQQDEKHITWARQKLTTIESMGYMIPAAFRQQMAERWGLTTELAGKEQSIEESWLPNGEGQTSMQRELRKVIKERHEKSDNRIMPSGDLDAVRDIKAILGKLDLRSRGSVSSLASQQTYTSNSNVTKLRSTPPSRENQNESSPGLSSPESTSSGIGSSVTWMDGRRGKTRDQ